MRLEDLKTKFNKNSVFNTHAKGDEALEHLLNGTMTNAGIARLLDKTPSAISQYKPRVMKFVDELKPVTKQLIKEQEQALKEISAPAGIMSLEEMGNMLRDNIDECVVIIQNVHSIIPLTDENAVAVQHLRLKAMDKMEKTMSMYFDRYGSLSEVKASAELKKIKEKVGKTVNFILNRFPDQPEIVQDYIKFLDQREEEKEDVQQ